MKLLILLIIVLSVTISGCVSQQNNKINENAKVASFGSGSHSEATGNKVIIYGENSSVEFFVEIADNDLERQGG